MDTDRQKLIAWGAVFQRLFDPSPAQVALIDLNGVIVQVNSAWRRFGRENSISPVYECVGHNYLQACESAAMSNYPSAREAYTGLLEVMNANRPKFTMVYPCHSPTQRRFYRMWVEPQMPSVPAIVIAHYVCQTKPKVDANEATRFVVPPSGDSLLAGAAFCR